MVQMRESKAINKLCVREILSLSFACGAYFFEFRGRKFVLVSRIISIGGGTCKFAPEAGKARMRTAFFTRVDCIKNTTVEFSFRSLSLRCREARHLSFVSHVPLMFLYK